MLQRVGDYDSQRLSELVRCPQLVLPDTLADCEFSPVSACNLQPPFPLTPEWQATLMLRNRRNNHAVWIVLGNVDSLSAHRGPHKGAPSAIADARRLTSLLREQLAQRGAR